MKTYPRVLVITHNPFDLHKNNGKTLNLLFKGWNPEAIAQLFFYDEFPESTYCSAYFRITDKNVLRSLFFLSPRSNCGSPVSNTKHEAAAITGSNKPNPLVSLIKKVKNISVPVKIVRDLFWASGVWKTTALKTWLKKVDPEIVFWGVGDCRFSAEIAYWVSVYLNIPLCMYYGDDYVLNSNYGGFFSRWQHKRVKSFHDRNLRHASKLIAIGDLMASEYQKAYEKEVVVVRTSVDTTGPIVKNEDRSNRENMVMSYVGGLALNRWKSIVELGMLVREAQPLIERKIVFNIYSLGHISPAIIDKLNESPLHFCGAIYGNDVKNVMLNSDILVHVESFDLKYRKLTSLSISTKIPEYLASGKCIVGYGPAEVASMRLLAENNIGLSLTDEDTHDSKINKLLSVLLNENERQVIGIRAKDFANEKFNGLINNEILRTSLLECVEAKQV